MQSRPLKAFALFCSVAIVVVAASGLHAQESSALFRTIVEYEQTRGSERISDSAVSIDPRAIVVRWNESTAPMGPRRFPVMEYAAVGGPALGENVPIAGSGSYRIAPREAIQACWRSEACRGDTEILLQFSQPLLEGNTAWVFVDRRLPVYGDGWVSFAGHEAVAVLLNKDGEWAIDSYTIFTSFD